MHWTDSRRGWVVYTAMCTPFIRRGSNPIRGIFGNIFIELLFLFYFINKNNQCNVCKYKYYLTTHTHMSEVEVYFLSINLTFWAMDKNVVGKKISRPAIRPPVGVQGQSPDGGPRRQSHLDAESFRIYEIDNQASTDCMAKIVQSEEEKKSWYDLFQNVCVFGIILKQINCSFCCFLNHIICFCKSRVMLCFVRQGKIPFVPVFIFIEEIVMEVQQQKS